MAHLLIFGLGYTAARIASQMQARGWQVTATGSAGDIAAGGAEQGYAYPLLRPA
jgi:hypothetical protein